MCQAYGFSGAGCNQIIVFRFAEDFEEAVAANPNMRAIIGADDITRKELPGVYIAVVMDN